MTTKKNFTDNKIWNILSVLLAVTAVISGIATNSFEHFNHASAKKDKPKRELRSNKNREIVIPQDNDEPESNVTDKNTPKKTAPVAKIEKDTITSTSNDTSHSNDSTTVNSEKTISLTDADKREMLDKIAKMQTEWPQLKCVEVSTVKGNEASQKLGALVLSFLKNQQLIAPDAAASQNIYGKSVKGIRIVISGECIVVEINEV